jgi:hypothetical protein
MQENRPLEALQGFESLVRAGVLQPATLAQFHAITGDLPGAEALAHAPGGHGTAPPLPFDCSALEAVPAIDAIVSLAADAHVTMVNENHVMPLQRAFSSLLVSALAPHGYSRFGAETFVGNVDGHVGRNGRPSAGIGMYAADPVFGQLVRSALGAGYTLFAYEQTAEQESFAAQAPSAGAAREQTQAANIARVIAAHPNARLYVHAGGEHVRKDAGGAGGIPRMAYRLWRLTGIEPVSVDLIGGAPSGARVLQSALYRGIERCGRIDAPVAFRKADGSYVARAGHDVTVFFPHTHYRGSRAEWLVTLLDRQLRTIRIAPEPVRTLLRAFSVGDAETAIPIDQILVPPGAASATLAIPAGRHRIVREWADGRSVVIGAMHTGAGG